MEPWHKVVTPRKEVREGRSFNPDEFAIALEQAVAGTAWRRQDAYTTVLCHLVDQRQKQKFKTKYRPPCLSK
jgi:hypothetical protein